MTTALIIVDAQNDFCPGGALAVPRGDEVVAVANRLARTVDLVVATRDWHPRRTTHFKEFGGVWPVHCVAGTPGAAFHPDLNLKGVHVFSKGMGATEDAYSGFEARNDEGGLDTFLRRRGVDTIVVIGLATDYCVKASALGGIARGYRVRLVRAGCRAVDINPGDGDRAIAEMAAAGALVD